jgi:hypothetical protein
MPVYKRFAIVYPPGDYPGYSEQMTEYLPNLLKHFYVSTPGSQQGKSKPQYREE